MEFIRDLEVQGLRRKSPALSIYLQGEPLFQIRHFMAQNQSLNIRIDDRIDTHIHASRYRLAVRGLYLYSDLMVHKLRGFPY